MSQNVFSAQQLCFNVHGSYHCGCYEGWSIDPSNPTQCVDDDECLVSRTTQALTGGKARYSNEILIFDKVTLCELCSFFYLTL